MALALGGLAMAGLMGCGGDNEAITGAPHEENGPPVCRCGSLEVACLPDGRQPDCPSDTVGPSEDPAGFPDSFWADPTDGTALLLPDTPTRFEHRPFPSDARRNGEGRVEWGDFPNPSGSRLLGDYLAFAAEHVRGFSANGAIYLTFSGPIDTTTLPTAAASLKSDAALRLLDLDDPTATAVPLQWESYEQSDGFLAPHTLAVAPVFGFPLIGGRRYALIMLDTIRDATGTPLRAPGLLKRALWGHGGDSRFTDSFAPLRNWLWGDPARPDDAHEALAARIVAATVFTVQDATSELKQLRDHVKSVTGAQAGVVRVGPESSRDVANVYRYFSGKLRVPNYQHGKIPYARAVDGGGFRFDANGVPVVSHMEEIDFALSVPMGPPPAGGWPLTLCSHGTGGNYRSCFGSGAYDEANVLAKRGLATLGIDQPLHGTRDEGRNFDVDLMSFNLFNPAGARALFRQSAVDTFVLAALARDRRLDIPGGSTSDGKPIGFDPERVVFFGHSQGGLTGTLAAAFEEDVRAWMFSGAGGVLAITVVERKNPTDLLGALKDLLGIPESAPVTPLHPVATLLQTLVDITDPINYARLLRAQRHGNGSWSGRNVLYTSGYYDSMTPYATTEAVALAARLPPLGPLAWELPAFALANLPPVASPLRGNLAQGRYTGGFRQYKPSSPDEGHFTVYHNRAARDMYAGFLQSAVGAPDGVPTLEIAE